MVFDFFDSLRGLRPLRPHRFASKDAGQLCDLPYPPAPFPEGKGEMLRGLRPLHPHCFSSKDVGDSLSAPHHFASKMRGQLCGLPCTIPEREWLY